MEPLGFKFGIKFGSNFLVSALALRLRTCLRWDRAFFEMKVLDQIEASRVYSTNLENVLRYF